MEACLMESVVIIFCLCTSVTTLGSLPDITNKSLKPINSKDLGHLHPWMKTRPIHQENDKNLLKQRTSTSIAHSENINVNPTTSPKLQVKYKKINTKQDVHGMYLKETALSQPKSMLKNNLSLRKGVVKRNTSNKSTMISNIDTEITTEVNNLTVFSTSGKGIKNGMDNVDHKETELTSSISVRQAGNNLSVNSEYISSLGHVIPDFTTLHGSNSNRGSLGGYGECCCHDTRCDFSDCGLTSVPQHLPSKTTELSLRNNDITLLPTNAFSRYIFLERLSLAVNHIWVLEEGAFNGLTLLTSLDLTYNQIGCMKNLSSCIFLPLSSLKILRFSFNSFPRDSSPDVLLAYLHNLEELYIDNYGNKEFGPGFKNMTSLRKVTFSCFFCPLSFRLNTTFINLRHVKQLSIPDCGIYGPDIAIDLFSDFSNLTTLDISQNKNISMEYLPVIMWNFQNGSLETLIINNIVKKFSLNVISSNLTQSFPQTLTTLIARDNNIVSIEPNAVSMLPKSLKFIDLSGNYIVTNPDILHLSVADGLEVLLLNTQTCYEEPPDRSDQFILEYKENKYTDTMKYKQIIESRQQVIRTVLPPNLKRVHINMKYPLNLVYWDIDKSNNLEELDLRCSLLLMFDFEYLRVVNLPRLRILNLGRSSLRKILAYPLKSMPPITQLILESNKLNDFLSQYDCVFSGL